MSSEKVIKTNEYGFKTAVSRFDTVISNLGQAYKNIDNAIDDMQDNWIGASKNAFVCGSLSLQLNFTDRIDEFLQLRNYAYNAKEAIDSADESCSKKFD